MISSLFIFIYCVSLLDTVDNIKRVFRTLKKKREIPSKRR
jgi:hypothetical protein